MLVLPTETKGLPKKQNKEPHEAGSGTSEQGASPGVAYFNFATPTSNSNSPKQV
jgi:hypothetical protein